MILSASQVTDGQEGYDAFLMHLSWDHPEADPAGRSVPQSEGAVQLTTTH